MVKKCKNKDKKVDNDENTRSKMMGGHVWKVGPVLAILVGACACSVMLSAAARPDAAKPSASEKKFGFTRDDKVTVHLQGEDSGMGTGTVSGFLGDQVVVNFPGETDGFAFPPHELLKENGAEAVAHSTAIAEPLQELEDFEVPLELWEDKEVLAEGWSNALLGERLDWVRKHKLNGCNIPQYDCRLTPGQVKTLTEDNLKEPFILRNCHHLSLNLSIEHLQEQHGHLNLDIYNVDPLTIHHWEGQKKVPLRQYLQDLSTTKDSAFDATEESPVGLAIMKSFIQQHGSRNPVPLFALTNLFKQRPVLSFSPTKGGDVPFHWHYPGYLFLQHGLKLWFLQSPFKPPVSELAWHGIESWASEGYWNRVPVDKRPNHCLQQTGDLIYVPDAYWHATTALTQNFGYGYQGNALATIKNLPHEFVDLKKKELRDSILHNKNDPWANMKRELTYYEWLRDNVQPWDFSNRILIADLSLALGLQLEGNRRQPHLQKASAEYSNALQMVQKGWEDKRLASGEALALVSYYKETALKVPKFQELKLNFLESAGVKTGAEKIAASIRKQS